MTVQARRVKDLGQVGAEVWGGVSVEAGWAAHLPQVWAEIVCVRTAAQWSPILPASLAIKEIALRVEQK